MNFTGKIIALAQRRGGTTKDGKIWSSQDYVLETIEHYPQRVVFGVFGDNVQNFQLSVGDTVTVSLTFNARKGRTADSWFNNISCYAVEVKKAAPEPYGEVPSVFGTE